MHKLIIISGTPGTGKSTIALKLLKYLKKQPKLKQLTITRLDIHDHYKNISTKYNRSLRCYDIDLKKFETLINQQKKENNILIVYTHIAHLLPKKLVDLAIITTCPNLKKLETRLKTRKYQKSKIRDNLDSEIFQTCLYEASEKWNSFVLDTSKRTNTTKFLEQIKKQL